MEKLGKGGGGSYGIGVPGATVCSRFWYGLGGMGAELVGCRLSRESREAEETKRWLKGKDRIGEKWEEEGGDEKGKGAGK